MSIKVNNISNNAPAVLYYGEFYDTTTQTTGGTSTANLITFNTTDVAKGISGGTSALSGKIIVANAGAYAINLDAQMFLNGGGGGTNFTFWYAVNGNNATVSSYTYSLAVSGAQNLASMQDIAVFNAGDYIQLYWWASTNTYPQLLNTAAGTNPARPETASVNLSIWSVG